MVADWRCLSLFPTTCPHWWSPLRYPPEFRAPDCQPRFRSPQRLLRFFMCFPPPARFFIRVCSVSAILPFFYPNEGESSGYFFLPFKSRTLRFKNNPPLLYLSCWATTLPQKPPDRMSLDLIREGICFPTVLIVSPC